MNTKVPKKYDIYDGSSIPAIWFPNTMKLESGPVLATRPRKGKKPQNYDPDPNHTHDVWNGPLLWIPKA